MQVEYDPAIHIRSQRVWDEMEERWMVPRQVRWYIEKDDTCSSTEPILFPFYTDYWSSSGQQSTCYLIGCDDDIAPDSCDAGSARTECSLTVNLDPVPSRFWTHRTNSKGKSYKRLNYVLGMQIESGGIKFDLRVDDVVYGEVVANFDYH